MIVQPRHDPFDPSTVLVTALRETSPAVTVARDASWDGSTVASVLQVSGFTSVGQPGNRWLFEVRAAVVSAGPDYDSAYQEALSVQDSLLSLTGASGVQISSVRCVSEPTSLAPHQPSEAAQITASYHMYMRRKV